MFHALLGAYDLSMDAFHLIISYLRNRIQRVKIWGIYSNCAIVNHGASLASVLGMILFNIFLNDLFYVQMSGDIARYADDSNLYYENKGHDALKRVLENYVNSATTWFENIYVCKLCVITPILYILILVYFQTSIYGENIHIQDTMYISQIKMCLKASSG